MSSKTMAKRLGSTRDLSKPKFDKKQMKMLREVFETWDSVDGNDKLSKKELAKAFKKLGEFKDKSTLDEIMKKADKNGDGELDFDEFVQAVWDNDPTIVSAAMKEEELITVRSRQKDGGSVCHTYAQEEVSAFAEHFNYVLSDDKDVKHLLPIDPDGIDLCSKIADGLLLSKFINVAVPDTIDIRALNRKKGKKNISIYQKLENNTLVVNAAKSIGVQAVCGAEDLRDGAQKPHIILGMIWQMVKIQLLNQINLKAHPELIRLLQDDETLQDLLNMPAEQLLLRWFNYHLREAGEDRRVKNFGKDVCDSHCYTILLNRLNPKKCDKKALETKNKKARAKMVLKNADNLGAKVFIKPKDIVERNEHLNLAFTASVFNHCPGLEPLTEEEEKEMAGMMDDDVGDSREERAFRMWINTLGLKDGKGKDIYINNLFEDCRDGLVLLRILDKIQPGCVSWGKVEKKPKNKFKKVSNCNYVTVLGKSLKFVLVGIQGSNFVDGHKTYTLALVWQMMRFHSIKFLEALTKGGKKVDDKDILKWCNKMAEASGKTKLKIKSFGDAKKLGDGRYFNYVCGGIWGADYVDWDLITDGKSEEDAIMNARYALSIARKKNCTIFLLPEDIVEGKAKMCLTFGAALMKEGLKLKK